MPRQVQVTVATEEVDFDEQAPTIEVSGATKEEMFQAVAAHLASRKLPPPLELLLWIDANFRHKPNWLPTGGWADWICVMDEHLAKPHMRILAIIGAFNDADAFPPIYERRPPEPEARMTAHKLMLNPYRHLAGA